MTYRPDFSGIWAKLARAEQHREALQYEIGFFPGGGGPPVHPEANRVPMRLEFEPETGDHVFRATARPSEDAILRWGLLIGDTAHNLRCALDHLVWQLSLHALDGREPADAEKVKFPITDVAPEGVAPEDFKAAGALKDVLPEHRALIYAHQPYGASHDPYVGFTHYLLRLRELTNHDKHRVITPVLVLPDRYEIDRNLFGDAGGEIVESTYADDSSAWLLEREAEIMRVKVRPASLQMNMEVAGYLRPNVCFRYFAPNPVTGKGKVRVTAPADVELLEISARVLDVIREFEDLF